MVGVVTNNFSIKLDAGNDTKNTNTKNTNTTNNNSDDVKNEEQPSTEALFGVFDQKDPTVFEEVEKKSEMTLKSQIDPLVKPTNLYSTVTVGTA